MSLPDERTGVHYEENLMSSGPDWMTVLARKIIRAREAKKWNQSDLARASGVSQTTISNIELGKTGQPKAKNLEAIAKALDLKAGELKKLAGLLNEGDLVELKATDPDSAAEEHRQRRIRQLLDVLARLPEEDQARIMEMIVMLPQLDDRNQDALIMMAKTLLHQQTA
jgi:transcriptional regulator with XRE-family HTH domain